MNETSQGINDGTQKSVSSDDSLDFYLKAF